MTIISAPLAASAANWGSWFMASTLALVKQIKEYGTHKFHANEGVAELTWSAPRSFWIEMHRSGPDKSWTGQLIQSVHPTHHRLMGEFRGRRPPGGPSQPVVWTCRMLPGLRHWRRACPRGHTVLALGGTRALAAEAT